MEDSFTRLTSSSTLTAPLAIVAIILPGKKQDSQFGSSQNFITIDRGGSQSLWV